METMEGTHEISLSAIFGKDQREIELGTISPQDMKVDAHYGPS
jgi:hypothetical protein